MSDYYGQVDGPRPSDITTAINEDPFESLLGMCRILGIHYEVKQHGDKWSATLNPVGHWPADFYQYSGERDNRRPGVSAVNFSNRLEALRVAFSMLYNSLWDSCRHWRDIVSQQDNYKDWFPIETARRAAERAAYEREQAAIAAEAEKKTC
jgi:hypothetical protein